MSDAADQVAQINAKLGQLRAEIEKAFVGQGPIVEELLIALLAGGHVLLEGVPGLGKTLLVKAMASATGGAFARIQFTPDLMPSDVTGHAMFDAREGTFRVRKGPVFTNLLLADEINRAPAKTQAALLEVMQESQVTIEGKAMPVPLPFMTVATQNPVEYEGTYPLPEAQLDRFLLKVLIDYPQKEDEQRIVEVVTGGLIGDGLNVDAVTEIMTTDEVRHAQQVAASAHVDAAVMDYAVRVTRETRESSGIRLGAGPRGAIALVRAARAAALVAGRDFVTPDDIRRVAVPALRHRIALAPELEIEAYRPDDILQDVLEHVSAPRQ